MPKTVFHVVLGVLLCGGCSSWHGINRQRTLTQDDSLVQASAHAGARHEKAIRRMEVCDFYGAERILKQILAADDNFGPAHNSLGKVYLAQHMPYPAAREFDRAARLMTDRPEPINNLGMVYESVGRFDESIAQYEQAHSMDATNPEYLGNLIRARFRRGDDPLELAGLLESLVAIDHRPDWAAWAKERLNTGDIGRFGGTNYPEIIEAPPIEVDPNLIPNLQDAPELILPGATETPMQQLPSPPSVYRLDDQGYKPN